MKDLRAGEELNWERTMICQVSHVPVCEVLGEPMSLSLMHHGWHALPGSKLTSSIPMIPVDITTGSLPMIQSANQIQSSPWSRRTPSVRTTENESSCVLHLESLLCSGRRNWLMSQSPVIPGCLLCLSVLILLPKRMGCKVGIMTQLLYSKIMGNNWHENINIGSQGLDLGKPSRTPFAFHEDNSKIWSVSCPDSCLVKTQDHKNLNLKWPVIIPKNQMMKRQKCLLPQMDLNPRLG